MKFGGWTLGDLAGEPGKLISVFQPTRSSSMLVGPKPEVPSRAYHLFDGPLVAALSMGRYPRPHLFRSAVAQVFGPGDRSWYVTTEVDYELRVIGGSRELVNRVSASGLQVRDAGPSAGRRGRRRRRFRIGDRARTRIQGLADGGGDRGKSLL